MTLTNLFNPFMKLLLRSPLHMIASKSTLLLTFTGRNSGKSYTTPVNYAIIRDAIYITSYRSRGWWRNLRGGARVNVCLKGRNMEATGEVIEDSEKVSKQLMEYLQNVPQYRRYFWVRLDSKGHPDPEDVALAGQDRVMVKLKKKIQVIP